MPDQERRLLDIQDLRVYFHTRDGVVKAVDGVDLHVHAGEIVGLVGESGCGKSVTSLSIMRLVAPPGRIEHGRILFEGKDLLGLGRRDMTRLRGDRLSMIFQQPTSSLNPVVQTGYQIGEVFEIHRAMRRKAGRQRAVEMLHLVGIPDPERRVNAYPHELSGGMAQRVMIAMALACSPQLLIADEPTTALDVTIQAQILDLMRGLQRQFNTAIILITHDLGVVAEMASRAAVMYAGEIVEQTDTHNLFRSPCHPYTRGLIGSSPVLGSVKPFLDIIPGNVPNLIDLPPGCRFAPRCLARIEHKLDVCLHARPPLTSIGPGHDVRCWLAAPEARESLHER